jgi:hypothetical protein
LSGEPDTNPRPWSSGLRLLSRSAAGGAGLVCFVNGSFVLLAVFFDGLNGTTFAEFVAEKNLVGVILAVSFSVVGALVAARRPGNPIGWIYLAIGFSQGFVTFAYSYATYALVTAPGSLPGGEPMSVLGQIAWMPGLSLMLTYVLLLFPTGRLPSRRWRPVAWLSAVPLLIMAPGIVWFLPQGGVEMLEGGESAEPGGLFGLALGALFPLILLCGLSSLASLVVRFWYSRSVERQQIKWFTYAAGLTFSMLVLGEVVEVEAIQALDWILTPLAAAIPVATGIAILRYRLFDIDVVVNRTIVYSSLTATLALVYFGGVASSQYVFRLLTGQETQLAVVASTLAIAVLFNPLRRGVQSLVDRRFYRRKYDAQAALREFGVKLRDETDLDSLNAELISAVRKTIQPEHVSLWVREEDRRKIEKLLEKGCP